MATIKITRVPEIVTEPPPKRFLIELSCSLDEVREFIKVHDYSIEPGDSGLLDLLYSQLRSLKLHRE